MQQDLASPGLTSALHRGYEPVLDPGGASGGAAPRGLWCMRSSVLMDSSKSQRGKAEQPGASMRASWGLVLLVPKNNPLLGACGWQRSQHREHQPGAGGCLCLGGCLHQGGCLLLRPTTSSTRMEQGPLSHWIPVRYSQHQSIQGKKKNTEKRHWCKMTLVRPDTGAPGFGAAPHACRATPAQHPHPFPATQTPSSTWKTSDGERAGMREPLSWQPTQA